MGTSPSALGMVLDIPNSAVAIVNVDVTAPNAPFGATADYVISQIGQEISYDGLTISSKSVGFTGLSFPLTGEFSTQLQILNQSGQDLDSNDLFAQFSDACNTLGYQLNSFGVLSVTGAPTGVNSGTGAQGNTTTVTGAGQIANASGGASSPAVHQCGDPTWSGWQDPVQYIKCLTQGGLTTIGILAIGLLIGVVLIVVAEKRPGSPV